MAESWLNDAICDTSLNCSLYNWDRVTARSRLPVNRIAKVRVAGVAVCAARAQLGRHVTVMVRVKPALQTFAARATLIVPLSAPIPIAIKVLRRFELVLSRDGL